MKYLVLAFSLLSGFTVFSQGGKSHSPLTAEYIRTSACANSEGGSCTRGALEQAILPVLESHLRDLPVDTLDLSLAFTVTPKGQMDRCNVLTNLGKTSLSERIKKKLQKAVKNSGPYLVSDPNSGPYASWHRFEYGYEVLKRENRLNPVGPKPPYKGGVVLQIPLFPPCERAGDMKDRECFQQRMKNHIETHFRYPPAAMQQGIQGNVVVQFTIDQNGVVANATAKGPHPLLTGEALRIVSLLPEFQPAAENGNPVSIPYSIPIDFKLNGNP